MNAITLNEDCSVGQEVLANQFAIADEIFEELEKVLCGIAIEKDFTHQLLLIPILARVLSFHRSVYFLCKHALTGRVKPPANS